MEEPLIKMDIKEIYFIEQNGKKIIFESYDGACECLKDQIINNCIIRYAGSVPPDENSFNIVERKTTNPFWNFSLNREIFDRKDLYKFLRFVLENITEDELKIFSSTEKNG